MQAAERVLARSRPALAVGFDPTLIIVIVQVIVVLVDEWRKCQQDKPIQHAGLLAAAVFRRRSTRIMRRALLDARMDETMDNVLGNAIIDELMSGKPEEVRAVIKAAPAI